MAANHMINGVADFYDDFLGPFDATALFANRSEFLLGTGTLSVTPLGINGGGARLTIDNNAAGDILLFGQLAWEPDEAGLVVYQARYRMNTTLATCAVFTGMANLVTTAHAFSYEAGTIVSAPTDGFGLQYEGAQSALFYTIGSGNNVDDTARVTTNIDATALATWRTIRIEADNRGNAARTTIRYRTFVDGVLVDTAGTDAAGWTYTVARSAQVYAPIICLSGRSAAQTVDVAEWMCKGGKGASFD